MADEFDAYQEVLGIPPERQPPNYYDLVGVAWYEGDADDKSDAGEGDADDKSDAGASADGDGKDGKPADQGSLPKKKSHRRH